MRRSSDDRSRVPQGNLRGELAQLAQTWATAQYRMVVLAVQFDRSGEWALDGSRTCAHCVATIVDVEVATAREWLRIGRAIEKLSLINAAFREGSISFSKVRQLTRVATAENEAELLSIAERVPAGRLCSELARWLSRHEEPEETRRRQHAARSLTWRTDVDGMVVGTLRLTPEMAAMPMAAIDAWIMQRRSPSSDPATECGNHATADASIVRSVRKWASVAQQRADGLIKLIEGGGAIVETEVVLHVRGDGCTLDDGTPIADSVVERIAPTAFLRALIHDAERRPINASGRHRHPTKRQKRVAHERDGGCVDCGSTTLLEFDHEPDFELTRRTVVEELRERCWRCHRARHAAQRPRRRRRDPTGPA